MKTYKNASEVKEALLNCETVKIKGWVARIDENDDIEISSPNGAKTANDICYLEMAIADFMKEAGGMPDKTPSPVTFEAIPSGSGPLEDDSTSDKPWSDPKVNKQPVPQGATSEPGLGTDTTSDKPWVDPSVVKLPENSADMTLPDTNLGPDSGGNSVNWGDEQQTTQSEKQAQNDSTISVPSEDSEDNSPYAGVSGELPVVGEQVTPVDDFHNAGIVDTYAEPKREATYREMVAASPSANLLRDIGDTERWNARHLLAQEDALLEEEDPYDENLEEEEGHDMEARIKEAIHGKSGQDISLVEYIKEAVSTENMDSVDDLLSRGVQLEVIAQLAQDYGSHQITAYIQQMKENAGLGSAATRIKENWGQDGTYTRDMDAESAEDLYHLTRSLGQEDSYDWASSRPNAAGPGQDVPALPGGLAETPVDTGIGSMSTDKLAVDEAAKSYWIDYYKDYGRDLVKDNDSKKDKKDAPAKKENVQADRSVDDKFEPAVQEAPKPANQQTVKAQMQNGPGGAIPTPPTSSPDPGPAAPAPAPGAPAPGAPVPAEGPKPAAPAPGAGDEGLKALGWTDQDVQAMSDEDKTKIMQVKLRKPGAGVSETGAAPAAPIKPPVDPLGPGADPKGSPNTLPAAPAPGPAPVSMDEGKAPIASIDKAFAMLTREAQAAPAMPAPAPAAPAPAGPVGVPNPPADPNAPPADPNAPPAPGGEFAEADSSPEATALSVYNEIMEQEVKASTADQVPALKAQMLVQRLLTEVGMPINEARTLFGLTKDKGFNTLFK